MQELISRIVSNVGIDEGLAQKAVGMLLGFLQDQGEDSPAASLISQIPGAGDMIAQFGGGEEAAGGGGLMGSVMGAVSSLTGGSGGAGDMMAMGQSLMSEGMDMDQIKGVASETFNFAQENVGEDLVNQVKDSIPGIGQFL